MLSGYHFLKQFLKFGLFMMYLFSPKIQSQTTDIIADNIQSLTKHHHLDNIYLQTSKDLYETREDLWFKAYVLDSQSFIPSDRSKILFLQLIEDKTNKVAWEEKYEIENGFVDGHLYLNDSLKPGSYSLAAYSSRSYYKGIKYFNALHKLQILKNISEKTTLKIVTAKKDSIISFVTFPEGGNIISGIQNRIAFKALDSKGLPIDVAGKLYENNVPLLDFKSIHDGMGSFIFSPNSNRKYHIKIIDYESIEYQLPEIQTKGISMQLLNNDKDFATFKVEKNYNTPKENVYLRVQSRGIVYSVAIGVLKDKLIIQIPVKDIPQGIAEATLFNSNVEPIAERLIYINPQKKLNIETKLDKSEYLKREKVSLKIKVTDQDNQAVITNLGVSIFDQLYNNKLDSKNILTHYYLSTQLNGKIYDPGYYFNEENNNRNKALDLLLLTQGWRRYVWNESNLKEHNTLYKTVLSDSTTGHLVLENPNRKPTESTPKIVMIFTAGSQKGQDIFATDSKGNFSVSPYHLKMGEAGYLYIKPMTSEKPKYIINLKDDSFDIINSNRKEITINYPFPKLQNEYDNDTKDILERHNDIQRLNEVVIATNKKMIFRDKYLGTLDSLNRFDSRNPDFVCLAGGLEHPILNCFMSNHHEGKTRAPIDGEKVTVLLGKNGEILGSDYPQQAYYGAKEIIYKDPNQNLSEEQLLKKFNLKMIKGYYGKREFYQAIYDKVTINDPTPDYRNTLFWKPDVITNEQGEAVIEFYCSDINTIFSGNIEGVSGTGLIGTKNFSFKVRNNEN